MINLDDLKMSKKLLILVVVGIACTLVVGYFGISGSGTINEVLEELYDIKYTHTVQAEDALVEMLKYSNGMGNYILAPDKAGKDKIKKEQLNPAQEAFNKKIAEYEALGMTGEGEVVIEDVRKQSKEFFDVTQKVAALTYEGKDKEAIDMRMNEALPRLTEAMNSLHKLVDINKKDALEYYKESDIVFANTLMTIIFAIIIGIIILALSSWYIVRNLTRRFDILLNGMKEVGDGNLAFRINMEGGDELSVIGSSFDEMTVNLERQTREIQENLEKSNRANQEIVAVAGEINKGNLDAMIRTENYDGEHLTLANGVNDLVKAFVIPFREVVRITKAFGEYDFAVEIDSSHEAEGEFLVLKNALYDTKVNLANAMRAINGQVNELVANAEEANASTEEVAASAKTLADSSEVVSENAEKSSHGVNQVLKAMEDLTTTVNQVATKADQVSKLTMEADDLSKEGATLAGVAEKGMQGITESTKETQVIIGDIRSQMEEIGKIVGLIRDISDQTSLLALNAAIEAARAGEAGLGFAVVADEVKSLAQETQTSAEDIANIIENLQKRSVLAGEAMEKTATEVDAGGKALGDTLNAFTRIVELIEDINHNVADVAAASEEQAASVEEITASVHEVGKLVEETTKEADMSAQSSNEAATAVNQISIIINNLNGIVEGVQQQVNMFRI
jgi:methyl-accepting chemotaxis protein